MPEIINGIPSAASTEEHIITDEAATLLNTTHRTSDGKNHADVVTNTSGIATNVTAVALNTTHRGSDGKNHADVVTNTSGIATNVTAIGLNTTHRGVTTGNPHSVSASDISLGNVSNVATSDTAYNATSWNANSDAATKNAIRDKIETMDSAIAGAGGETYVDRGDPAPVYDWAESIGGVTFDSTWRVLDMSSIVPAAAANKRVLLKVKHKHASVQTVVKFRINGNSYEGNVFEIMNEVTNSYRAQEGIVVCDADRKVEYYGTAGTVECLIFVRGWWI